jgi:hypothetical protein
METFLLRHPGSCSGMFWRGDPTGTIPKSSKLPDWPRNGAKLLGIVRNYDRKYENTNKWLEVLAYYPGGKQHEEIKLPPGVFMPFEQGGVLLHPCVPGS